VHTIQTHYTCEHHKDINHSNICTPYTGEISSALNLDNIGTLSLVICVHIRGTITISLSLSLSLYVCVCVCDMYRSADIIEGHFPILNWLDIRIKGLYSDILYSTLGRSDHEGIDQHLIKEKLKGEEAV